MKLAVRLIPAAIGAAVGIGSACLVPQRKSRYGMLVGGVVGGSLAYGGSLAWDSRHKTAALANQAMRRVNDYRDARWLAKNPIAYA
jgi:hypothetical protein